MKVPRGAVIIPVPGIPAPEADPMTPGDNLEPRHRNGIDVNNNTPLREANVQSPGRGAAALDAMRKAARFCDESLGWSRIGFLLSLTIIVIAALALFRILRHIKVAAVMAAMLASHVSDIAWAAVFVAGGYFTLTFYDLFALRTIGCAKVP